MQSTSLQTLVPRPNCCRPCKASSHVPRYCDLIVMAIESLSRSSYLTSRRSLKFLMLFRPLTSIEGFLKSCESYFNQTSFGMVLTFELISLVLVLGICENWNQWFFENSNYHTTLVQSTNLKHVLMFFGSIHQDTFQSLLWF